MVVVRPSCVFPRVVIQEQSSPPSIGTDETGCSALFCSLGCVACKPLEFSCWRELLATLGIRRLSAGDKWIIVSLQATTFRRDQQQKIDYIYLQSMRVLIRPHHNEQVRHLMFRLV